MTAPEPMRLRSARTAVLLPTPGAPRTSSTSTERSLIDTSEVVAAVAVRVPGLGPELLAERRGEGAVPPPLEGAELQVPVHVGVEHVAHLDVAVPPDDRLLERPIAGARRRG